MDENFREQNSVMPPVEIHAFTTYSSRRSPASAKARTVGDRDDAPTDAAARLELVP